MSEMMPGILESTYMKTTLSWLHHQIILYPAPSSCL